MVIDKYDETRLILDSGWRVHTDDSLSFTDPHGMIYDRCGSTLFSRCRPVCSVDLFEIFTDEEWIYYKSCFES